MGAPEVCPLGVEAGQVPADLTKKTPISGQIAARRAICAACEHFQTSACCNCPTARKDPARELADCRFGLWALAPETAGDTLRETTGHSHALGNRQLENPG